MQNIRREFLFITMIMLILIGCSDLTISYSPVVVSPATVTVEKGQTQQFIATVRGSDNPQQTFFDWTVTGGASNSTSILPSGLLIVASDETATTLTVTAAAINTSATVTSNGIATVTVPQIEADIISKE